MSVPLPVTVSEPVIETSPSREMFASLEVQLLAFIPVKPLPSP